MKRVVRWREATKVTASGRPMRVAAKAAGLGSENGIRGIPCGKRDGKLPV